MKNAEQIKNQEDFSRQYNGPLSGHKHSRTPWEHYTNYGVDWDHAGVGWVFKLFRESKHDVKHRVTTLLREGTPRQSLT